MDIGIQWQRIQPAGGVHDNAGLALIVNGIARRDAFCITVTCTDCAYNRRRVQSIAGTSHRNAVPHVYPASIATRHTYTSANSSCDLCRVKDGCAKREHCLIRFSCGVYELDSGDDCGDCDDDYDDCDRGSNEFPGTIGDADCRPHGRFVHRDASYADPNIVLHPDSFDLASSYQQYWNGHQ